MNRPASSPSDAELLAQAACRHNTARGGADACRCDDGRPCLAAEFFGPLAEAQCEVLRAAHRLISSPYQGARR